MIKQRIFDLMKAWCDGVLSYSVSHDDKCLDGAILCPSCTLVHGRIADMVFPLMLLYRETDEEYYYERAKQLVDWAENNVRLNRGATKGMYRNDVNNYWLGISVFFAQSLGKTLVYLKDSIDAETYEKWQAIFSRVCEKCLTYFDNSHAHINYPASNAALMAFVYKITGDERYKLKADKIEEYCRTLFDKNGLLCGEGYPHNTESTKGCHYIDIGYNIEESMPALLEYAHLTENEELLSFYKERMLDHLELLLPDGGIDNSFGSRNNKWTYWGSRTSDGMIGALSHLTGEKVFARALEKHLTLLESCTYEGLLSCGTMSYTAGEPSCLHHSFCHAKALAEAYLFINEKDFENLDCLLPRELEYGIKTLQNGNVALVSRGGWRATVSAVDMTYRPKGVENFGGSLTLLWHEKTGPLCAGVPNRFVLEEIFNMQFSRFNEGEVSITPRIRCPEGESDCDRGAVLTVTGDKINVKGNDNFAYEIEYTFLESSLEISVLCEKSGEFFIPIAALPKTKVTISEKGVNIGGAVTLESAAVKNKDESERLFHPVSGLCTFPLRIALKSGEKQTFSIKV